MRFLTLAFPPRELRCLTLDSLYFVYLFLGKFVLDYVWTVSFLSPEIYRCALYLIHPRS